MLRNLLAFFKNLSCTPLFHPACFFYFYEIDSLRLFYPAGIVRLLEFLKHISLSIMFVHSFVFINYKVWLLLLAIRQLSEGSF